MQAVAERETPDTDNHDPTPSAARSSPGTEPPATVGTGTVLGIGCIALAVLVMVAALALRWLTGVW
ncbi:MAG: hypothetical protein M3Q50_05235 [Chloroflexota bacterium]|nr:hypothetical protein [Chloroflexia bacterium]MDQ3081509.1 hypothetical protein [Gemmatimonadota bacterium]MDQ3226019.1 hypothetical protein [Chloroflexota bacterium]